MPWSNSIWSPTEGDHKLPLADSRQPLRQPLALNVQPQGAFLQHQMLQSLLLQGLVPVLHTQYLQQLMGSQGGVYDYSHYYYEPPLAQLLLEEEHARDVLLKIREGEVARLQRQVETLTRQLETARQAPGVVVPRAHQEAFDTIAGRLAVKERELAETRLRLEAMVTAVALRPGGDVDVGDYDVQAVAHLVVSKLEAVVRENEELHGMVAFGREAERRVRERVREQAVGELEEELRQKDEIIVGLREEIERLKGRR